MTDQACKVPGCPVPIMRSKDGSIRFCVKHDTLPTTSASGSATKKPSNNPTTTTTTATAAAIAHTSSSPVVPQETSKPSASQPLSSSLPEKQFISTENDEYAERERRREQSSKASQLIGQRLLQRWTLLNETCPNPSCYGVSFLVVFIS